MTRDVAIILVPIIKAYGEGKTIQSRPLLSMDESEWKDNFHPSFEENMFWRIKPEPELVPFDYEDNLIGKIIVYKRKYKGKYMIISQNEVEIVYIDESYGKITKTYANLLTYYAFIDGTNCGKKVE